MKGCVDVWWRFRRPEANSLAEVERLGFSRFLSGILVGPIDQSDNAFFIGAFIFLQLLDIPLIFIYIYNKYSLLLNLLCAIN